MKNRTLSIVGAVAFAPLLIAVLPQATANAHGYVSSPLSRQAQCAKNLVPCGAIKYEPQSVEGPKGLRSCNGGESRFAELNDDTKGWKPQSVSRAAAFTWTNTARHATSNWEYYIGTTRVGVVDGRGQQPPATVTHNIDLGNFTGRQKLLAIWNIADTGNAFYACIDLDINGGTPTTTPKPTTTTPQPTTTTPQPTTTTPTPGQWQAGGTYQAGDVVTYDGARYRCLQSHTASDPTWTPASTPALWQRL
ncbi:lytic polysaccharide monooxygenase [Nocardia sp. NPDC049149]|uniref:lytic polysaccharide monooxygenase n=1 Tax=Nocardia sp. NPDC049149 TaxID=3364315 RepID=UPI003717FC7C